MDGAVGTADKLDVAAGLILNVSPEGGPERDAEFRLDQMRMVTRTAQDGVDALGHQRNLAGAPDVQHGIHICGSQTGALTYGFNDADGALNQRRYYPLQIGAVQRRLEGGLRKPFDEEGL